MDISLSAQFQRALETAATSYNLPTIEEQTQKLIQSVLSDLRHVEYRISALSLFSPNESLEDISSRDLVYLFVPYVFAEVEGRVKTMHLEERMSHVIHAQRCLRAFVSDLERYNIIEESEQAAHDQSPYTVSDPAKRREAKIKEYKRAKELRQKIELLQKRRRQWPDDGQSPTDFELISSLLLSSPSIEDEEDDSEIDDIVREVTLLLLRLTFAQARAQLETMNQELELLRSAPRPPSASEETARDQEDDSWRLDSVSRGGGDGKRPLLDHSGKPLRPFTILPSGSGDRGRLQTQVFGPDHRLPTMSVDQYLEIERQRGNIITGGGPQSASQLTTSEQLALDAEMDGTIFGQEKAEEKRLQDERWAQYTDANPKGAGNTMNRG